MFAAARKTISIILTVGILICLGITALTGCALVSEPSAPPGTATTYKPSTPSTRGPTSTTSTSVPKASSSSSTTSAVAARMPASLVRVVDGDTIVVRLSGGSEERLRYIGIDTPELTHPDKRVQRMAQEAAKRNAALLAGGPLQLERDVQERDQYGRLLAYVWAGEVFVNLELVREGFATVYTVPPNVRYVEDFLRAQQAAREARLGLWASDFSEDTANQTKAVVQWYEAAEHLGERTTVEGPVVGATWAKNARGSPTFLDLGRRYPDPARFTVLIWGENRPAFSQAPESMYMGRVIRVTGEISSYKGVMQMVVRDPDQIEVVK